MKSIFNFGTDNPLTLDMGHPLELRLRSLQHVDRNKKVLPATIGAALLICRRPRYGCDRCRR